MGNCVDCFLFFEVKPRPLLSPGFQHQSETRTLLGTMLLKRLICYDEASIPQRELLKLLLSLRDDTPDSVHHVKLVESQTRATGVGLTCRLAE